MKIKYAVSFFEFKNLKESSLIFGVFLVLLSCSGNDARQKGLILSPKYQQINSIISIADCSGPSGNYTTEVRSAIDGRLAFIQRFGEQEAPFIAQLDGDNNGYVLDEKDTVVDTLSPEEVEMIRGHEIHKQLCRPDLFFENIHFEKNSIFLDQDHEVFVGVDKLDHQVKLFYDRKKKIINKIELLNSLDTSEVIEIISSGWQETEFGPLPGETAIVQAQKDTFRFNFHTIEINKQQ